MQPNDRHTQKTVSCIKSIIPLTFLFNKKNKLDKKIKIILVF